MQATGLAFFYTISHQDDESKDIRFFHCNPKKGELMLSSPFHTFTTNKE